MERAGLFLTAIIAISVLIPLPASARQPVGGGDLLFTPDNAPQVVFSHEGHLKGEKLKCANCHYRIFQMAHRSWKMEMGKITKGEFCGRCHDGRFAFDVKDEKNCARCHR